MPYALILKWLKGFVSRNIIPIAIVVVLSISHLWAYSKGKDTLDEYVKKERLEQYERLLKLTEEKKNAELELERVVARRLGDSKAQSERILKEVEDYVKAHPKDPSCNLNRDDVDFLRKYSEATK